MNQYEEFSFERKRLVKIGEAPDWYATAGYQLLVNREYLQPGETPKQMYQRIAKRASELTSKSVDSRLFGYDDWYSAFFDVMWKGWLSPSTPVLSNMGTNRGMSVSCSGSATSDSIRGWYLTRMEMAQLTQRGFGTSTSADPIRPRGSKISRGGTADGVMPYIEGVVDDMMKVSQGVNRRGGCAIYLNVLHPDFDELCDKLLAEPDGLNVGWTFTESFDELIERNPVEADRRWKKILRTKMITGKGYFFFAHKVNRQNPKMYKDRGLEVSHSNLCVTGDTKILTKEYGYIEIEKVAGQTLECWNGEEWSKTPLFKTHDNYDKIYKVELSNGNIIKCSDYHKWFIGKKEYIKRTWELEIGDVISEFIPPNGATISNITIVNVEWMEDVTEPLFCGTEPKRHKLMFNGVLTGNCNEISLFNDKDHSFTCVLSSLNIAKYDEWKDTKLPQIAMVFLDAVNEDLLEKAKQEEGFERIVNFAERTRAVGLGVLGLATYYQQKGWVFGDMQSVLFNQSLFKDLNKKTLEASKYLAEKVGEPEYMKGYGERFSHRMAIPPTMSTSNIMGGISQGQEPVFANVYVQETAGGIVFRVNPVLLPIMKERGVYNKETLSRISSDNGSVQAEDWLSDHEKAIFRTAFEISQDAILLMASHRQKDIDQGQSINLYFKYDTPEEEIARLHYKAYKDPYIKGLYYVRSLNKAMKVQVPTPVCEACEG